ncbi:hypothetical protein J437_LFUL005525 [Ladona fulva]|uniref:Major facilitator superfamily (MFS) profile domain-containing protein n=1 Tax=Ladona fulva TaxID=123851 RepID=A0A8K0K654_LADFU|nr:hypothetical protein J437_LFUL005525 [Ladona fulva]
METCSELIPARLVLGIMAFFALMFTQMLRANLYISIVGMVNYDIRSTNNSDSVQYQSSNSTLLPEENDISHLKGFEWDEATQGILFSAFYWCYWLTELPGGVMAQKWGGRKVLGVSIMVAALLNAMVPMASKVHLALLAVIRAVQGLSLTVSR